MLQNLENPIPVGRPVPTPPSDVPITQVPELPLPEQGPRFPSVVKMVPSDRKPFTTLSPE